jgi:Domain of unknown function (DUF892)
MAKAGTLHDAFVDELRDTYDAEKQLTKALAKMAKAATSPDLKEAFEAHLEETRGQIDRLDQVFASIDEKARGKHCEGIAGIIDEGKAIMEEEFDDSTMDACLIAAGQVRSITKWPRTGRLSRGQTQCAAQRLQTSCSRRWTRKRQRTRSCPRWQKEV